MSKYITFCLLDNYKAKCYNWFRSKQSVDTQTVANRDGSVLTMADRSNANTPTPPAPAQQPIQDIQSLVAAMQAMAQENQRLLQSTINDLRHQMTSEMQALRKEVED